MSGKSKAGVYSPGQLERTFARVPLEHITAARKGGMPIKWAVWLFLHSYCGAGDGAVWVSCARSEICSGLDLKESQVRTAVSSLIDDGILSVLEPGHNGRATVYCVNVAGKCPEPTPTMPEPTPTTLKGCLTATPTAAQAIPLALEATPTVPQAASTTEADPTEDGRGRSRKRPYDAVGVGPEAAPNRTFTEGSYRGPSAGEDYSSSEARVEGPLTGPEGEGRGYMTELQPVPTGPGESLASMFRRGGGRLHG